MKTKVSCKVEAGSKYTSVEIETEGAARPLDVLACVSTLYDLNEKVFKSSSSERSTYRVAFYRPTGNMMTVLSNISDALHSANQRLVELYPAVDLTLEESR